jgi:hypothetical protein
MKRGDAAMSRPPRKSSFLSTEKKRSDKRRKEKNQPF